jgi:hypothetical protein
MRWIALSFALALLVAAVVVQPVRYGGALMFDFTGQAVMADRYEAVWSEPEEMLRLQPAEIPIGADPISWMRPLEVRIRVGRYALQIAGALTVLALAVVLTRPRTARVASREPRSLYA